MTIPSWEYRQSVPRAAATTDVFRAIADPRRRDILLYLAAGERPVGEMRPDSICVNRLYRSI